MQFVLDLVNKLPQRTQDIVKQMPELIGTLPMTDSSLAMLEAMHNRIALGETLNMAEVAALILACNAAIYEGINLRERLFYITAEYMKEALRMQSIQRWSAPQNLRVG